MSGGFYAFFRGITIERIFSHGKLYFRHSDTSLDHITLYRYSYGTITKGVTKSCLKTVDALFTIVLDGAPRQIFGMTCIFSSV